MEIVKLTKNELRHVLGGAGQTTKCSTSCADGTSISVTCEGGCTATPNVSVTCTTGGTKYCPGKDPINK
ncbi:MAG: hypothetical protein FWC41_13410 [Firmicutes bacterium]|nr:hypothetical protein [Bacillota bacterium]